MEEHAENGSSLCAIRGLMPGNEAAADVIGVVVAIDSSPTDRGVAQRSWHKDCNPTE